MTEALNYTTKAITDLAWLAGQPGTGPLDRKGIHFLMGKLREAEVFVLPDAGELLDRSKPRPQVPGVMYKPAFPVVALEYAAIDRGTRDPIYESATAPRRISLIWEWDGTSPTGKHIAEPAAGSGVVVASIPFYTRQQRWIPVPGAVLIPYDCAYRVSEAGPSTRAFLASGRLTAKQAAQPSLVAAGVLALMPEYIGRVVVQGGLENGLSLISADLMDEVNAYIDLCVTLACNNVRKERQVQPAKLNKARIKAGKAPLKDFHILTIGGEQVAGGGPGGASSGARSHLRRGHIRRLSPDRVTWVNSCMVRGSRPGFVDKQYAPRAA